MHMTDISIHTPTKGVTDFQKKQYDTNKYFNPHSHEGSDLSSVSFCNEIQNFNPHSHEGSDASIGGKISIAWDISIHTPTKGVTFI